MAIPTTLVEAPAPGSSQHGLLSALQLRPNDGVRWQSVGVHYEAPATGPLRQYSSVACVPDALETPLELADAGSLAEFHPFTVYSSYDCSLASVTDEEAERLAVSRLTQHEEVTAEMKLWEKLGQSDADKVTAASAAALSVIEHHLVRNYGGGVIHVPRKLGHLVKDTSKSGGVLRTIGGVQVVLGGGYGTVTDKPTIYGTPVLFGYRSDITVYNTPNLGRNDHSVRAEREYLVGWATGKPVVWTSN